MMFFFLTVLALLILGLLALTLEASAAGARAVWVFEVSP